MTCTTRKVGGLRFVRVGRLQASFCICKPAKPSKADKPAKPSKPRGEYGALFFVDGITLALCAGILAHVFGG